MLTAFLTVNTLKRQTYGTTAQTFLRCTFMALSCLGEDHSEFPKSCLNPIQPLNCDTSQLKQGNLFQVLRRAMWFLTYLIGNVIKLAVSQVDSASVTGNMGRERGEGGGHQLSPGCTQMRLLWLHGICLLGHYDGDLLSIVSGIISVV